MTTKRKTPDNMKTALNAVYGKNSIFQSEGTNYAREVFGKNFIKECQNDSEKLKAFIMAMASELAKNIYDLDTKSETFGLKLSDIDTYNHINTSDTKAEFLAAKQSEFKKSIEQAMQEKQE